MNQKLVDTVVHAVLYEGYILYPYRASAKKNRQRFTFGRVYPEVKIISLDLLTDPAAGDRVLVRDGVAIGKVDGPILNEKIKYVSGNPR